MTTSVVRNRVGRWGEDAAADHLEKLGWRILERNWRCNRGEIDLIAVDTSGTIVIVEVKCRSGLGFGEPLEAITHAKLNKLIELTYLWLGEQKSRAKPISSKRIRIDGVGVLRTREGLEISHIKGLTQ